MICLQAFSSRSKVVDHISEKGEVCALNLAIFGTPMSLEQTAEMDAHDRATESTTRRTGRNHNYSPTMAKQAYGPVRPICVPNGHSRQSRHIPLRIALQVADEIEVADHSRLGGVVHTPIDTIIAELEPAIIVYDSSDEDDMPLPMLNPR